MAIGNFYKFGKIVYHCRFAIAIFWIILSLLCLFFILNLDNPFKETGFKDPKSESAQTELYLNKELGFGSSPLIVLYSNDNSKIIDFQDEIKLSLKNLKNFHIKNRVIYPDLNNKQISSNKHNAYAVILFNNKKEIDDGFLQQFKKILIKPHNLSMQVGGEPAFLEDTKMQTQLDLYKAEYIATPVAIITLLIVFGSVTAASLPIILAGVFTLLILTILYGLGHVFSLSVFTINIATLLGLCINIDYSLFIINRFRLELSQGASVIEAIAITQTTAGKAVFFSGLTVLISISALLLFPINIMFSVGVGGITAVALSVAISTILLPAILGMLGEKINSFSTNFFKLNTLNLWHLIATIIVKHRWTFFISLLCFLFLLSFPFLKAQFGISDARILPKTLESRQVFDVFKKNFGEGKLSPISVVVKTNKGDILSRSNLDRLNDITQLIKKDPRVSEVNSIVSSQTNLSIKEYYTIYHAPEKLKPESVKKLLETTTGKKFTVITVISKYSNNSTNTLELIDRIRLINPGKELSIAITGPSANMRDVLNSISHIIVYAAILIFAITYIILLILFRSIFLPLKAIFMNLLSICASYGILTFVFQEGHFQKLLNFEPQGILDVNLLIIIFCCLFGFSMDYEVFLLSRIKEVYERTGDNIKSTILGIEYSSRIITSAAIIVILICFSFMSADILIVKEFGLGIASAIFVDAFLIRCILVPTTMAILGKWNWYLPRWLDIILPNISFNTQTPKTKNIIKEDL